MIAPAVIGSHVLKIDGYSRTKELRNGNFINSKPFHIGGHLWFIRYYPDGNHKYCAGWISLFLHLTHDSETGVKVNMKLTLLDDAGDPVPSYTFAASSVQFSKSVCNGWGRPKFIQQKALEGSTYLKDDCFRVRCDLTVCTEAASQFVTVPPSDMTQHIGSLLSSGVEADVMFQVGEQRFAAHRLVLAARSSVFMAELFGPMKERRSNIIKIDDIEPGVFRAMLHFIYTDDLPVMRNGDTIAMVQHLLVAADRYDLQRLKLMCEHKLCGCINSSIVSTTLVLAEQHGCKGLKQACFMFLKSPVHLKKIMESDEFQHLTSSCPSLLNELFANVAR